jgi:hypothetical protein
MINVYRCARLNLPALAVVSSLIIASGTLAHAQTNAPITITVDAKADRHSISPYIYGVAFATEDQLKALNCPANRIGGEAYSRYNWKVNTYNSNQDGFFESVPSSFWPQPEFSMLPGERVDSIFAFTKAAGAQTLVTVPMIGWVAKVTDSTKTLYSFSVAKYGPQQKTDPNLPDAGNGIRPDGTHITGNDPNDANVPSDPEFMRGWVQHLIAKWGTADDGGVRFYILDNEPGIWQETHRDVVPVGPTSQQVLDDIFAYGSMIKSEDPDAQVVAPEEWGWLGYVDSGFDKQYGEAHGWPKTLPDRTSRGGMDNLPWILMKLRDHDRKTGKRLVDYFTVHYYPQGEGAGADNNTPDKQQLLRNRSTRSLWDPSYVDESWINKQIYLIPRMKQWVKDEYPGTKIGVTEYNWGAEDSIGGATAQADVLGIFGREGLDLATRWISPDPTSPVFKAMQLYRNYDGNDSTFGDESISDQASANPDDLSSFAAIRKSDGALTVMVINKDLTGSTPVTIALTHFARAGSAQVWQLTSSNQITQLATIPYSGGQIQTTLPAQSATLFVAPR